MWCCRAFCLKRKESEKRKEVSSAVNHRNNCDIKNAKHLDNTEEDINLQKPLKHHNGNKCSTQECSNEETLSRKCSETLNRSRDEIEASTDTTNDDVLENNGIHSDIEADKTHQSKNLELEASEVDIEDNFIAFSELDDIPLIDDNQSIDEVSSLVEKIKTGRPKFLSGNTPSGLYFNPMGLDSPDVFKLRAPIVSCENILTPGISSDQLLGKQI